MGKIKLFIVEDEMIIANDLKNQLTDCGYEVLGMEGKGEKVLPIFQALEKRKIRPDIVLMDIKLAGKMDGIETARILTEKYPCGIIFLTVMNNRVTFNKSIAVKPYAYVLKPVDIEQLRMTIELAYYQFTLEMSHAKVIADLKSEVDRRIRAEKENESRLQEKIKAEHKANQLLKQKHLMEMDLINRELATSATFISQKNKIIALIRKDVNRFIRKGKTITKADLIGTLKTVDENVKFENDWYRIKAHFEKIYPGYFERLREKFPNLTPNDHKLCALLRMNLATKEISQILKITAPSTEISRIRLRKKLSLPKGVNLIQFICNV
ncbi:MAG: response regulator [Bacteroidetes bacterium]|nr:response regulator [Bacteroidota bacterium]